MADIEIVSFGYGHAIPNCDTCSGGGLIWIHGVPSRCPDC